MAKLIFGCGYLGHRVAQRWRAGSHDVTVVTRSSERARALAAEGFRPLVADVLRAASLADLPAAETVLFAVGFDRGAGASIHDVFVDGFARVLAALPEGIGRLIYVSSTGVYHQSQGDWVDEDSPCEPVREGGRACLAAEQALWGSRFANRGIVLRMAGLYGPGRIPNADGLRRGEAISAPDRGFMNLIHVDDAATAVLAAEIRGRPPRTYLISDGHPVERRVYYEELARLLAAPAPRFDSPRADAPATARAASDKRVKNERMGAELKIPLAYPSYREGLAAIVPPTV